MTPEQIRTKEGFRDTNTYLVTTEDFSGDIELVFIAKVDINYKDWIDMQEFWMNHKDRLAKAKGDVIKSVLHFYSEIIINYLIGNPNWTNKSVQNMLDEFEGVLSTPEVNITITSFHFEPDITTNYKILPE